jgi:hypothetical protein
MGEQANTLPCSVSPESTAVFIAENTIAAIVTMGIARNSVSTLRRAKLTSNNQVERQAWCEHIRRGSWSFGIPSLFGG